jgi:hypothetical protein
MNRNNEIHFMDKTPDEKTETQENPDEIKVIPYQSYRKIHSTAPSKPAQTSRPFRRGEKRIATLTTSWKTNVKQEQLSDTENQLEILRTLEEQPNAPFLKSLVARKLKSYHEQDAKKQFHLVSSTAPDSPNNTITIEETVRLLVDSKMACYYCQEVMLFFYETVREPKQWTLERLNNEFPHTRENVVIACLQCNLRRRCMNGERYQKTKQMMQIHKLDDPL